MKTLANNGLGDDLGDGEQAQATKGDAKGSRADTAAAAKAKAAKAGDHGRLRPGEDAHAGGAAPEKGAVCLSCLGGRCAFCKPPDEFNNT